MGAQVATPLAVALNELVQNAVEHAFATPGRHVGQPPAYEFSNAHHNPGSSDAGNEERESTEVGGPEPPEVHITFDRQGDELFVRVKDNGTGLPPGFSIDATTSLGLSIVRGLVNSQLGGKIDMYNSNGTVVELVIPVDRPETSDLARI
jgi:two-component sensor histidine kinase